MLYFLAGDDVTKIKQLKTEVPIKTLYEFTYLKRIKQLNEMKLNLEQLKKAKN